MKKLAALCFFLASSAFAGEPVLIDCEYFSTYLYHLADLRDEGKSENEVLAAIDNTLNPKVHRHLERVVSRWVFTYRNEFSKEAMSKSYLKGCKARNGYIPENEETD